MAENDPPLKFDDVRLTTTSLLLMLPDPATVPWPTWLPESSKAVQVRLSPTPRPFAVTPMPVTCDGLPDPLAVMPMTRCSPLSMKLLPTPMVLEFVFTVDSEPLEAKPAALRLNVLVPSENE